MADIRPVDVIAAKWANVTPQRSADYEAGVSNPRKDWARQAGNAQDAWAAGVQAAVANKSFGKGVARAGTPKWQRGATEKGVARWGPGVQLAQEAYATGFAPFREAIARVQLPPRFARRDPRNLERVKAVVDALKRAKEAPGT
jgi:hypothetical protein